MATTSSPATQAPEILLTRVFDAPRHLVFEVWTKPEHLVRWFAPQGFTIPYWEMDFRPGGTFRTCMSSPQFGDSPWGGVFREIVDQERLVWVSKLDFDPDNEIVTTVTFAEQGGKTEVTVRQTFTRASPGTEGAQLGWSQTLDHLAEYLQTM